MLYSGPSSISFEIADFFTDFSSFIGFSDMYFLSESSKACNDS